MYKEHIQRLHDGINNTYNLFNLAPWIRQYTFLEGRPFSFKDHEYQLDIISDPCRTVLVNKCAQVGLSEIFARWALAVAATQENFTLIWTFPSATDAERFAKARLDPIVAGSKALSHKISKSINSTELKQFGSNTFVYIRGTVSDTAGLSVPADILIHDELDRSDIDNISAYVSRLQHKPTKIRRLFSTPTARGYGIDKECATARRKRQFWKCSHCNHYFMPDYEEDVHIPGWNKGKKEINRYNLKDINYNAAVLLCPNCKKQPDPSLQYREWIVENDQDRYETVAYYVSPFCAPKVITPADLVRDSTVYGTWAEFVNQGLGLTSEDNAEALTISDIEKACVTGDFYSSDIHVLGVDMGLVCYFTVAKVQGEKLIVVHREKCGFADFEVKRRHLCLHYRCVASVHDAFPYTDLVARVTKFDPNAYGAVYVNRFSTELYTIKEQDANPMEGKLNIRAVHINREVSFDALMWAIKQGNVIVGNGDEEFKLHLLDMKRIKKFDKNGGVFYKWEKTNGIDHWHHCLLYAFIASKLRGMLTWATPGIVPLVSKFKIPGATLAKDRYDPGAFDKRFR